MDREYFTELWGIYCRLSRDQPMAMRKLPGTPGYKQRMTAEVGVEGRVGRRKESLALLVPPAKAWQMRQHESLAEDWGICWESQALRKGFDHREHQHR